MYSSARVKEIKEATFELKEKATRGKPVDAYEAVRWMVPIHSTLNYFECEIISKGEVRHGIWIGMSRPNTNEEYDADHFKNIACYRVDNGHIHRDEACSDQDCKHGTAMTLNLTYSEGDRIGCGIDFDYDQSESNCVYIFFTKNGMQVGDLIRCNKPYMYDYDPYPVVGMGELGEKIRFLQHCYRPSLLSVSKAQRYSTYTPKSLSVDNCSQETYRRRIRACN